MPRRKKRSATNKPPIELTTDEALEMLFSTEVRDKLKQIAEDHDRYYRKRSSHQ